LSLKSKKRNIDKGKVNCLLLDKLKCDKVTEHQITQSIFLTKNKVALLVINVAKKSKNERHLNAITI
jgi:hypothetical protein